MDYNSLEQLMGDIYLSEPGAKPAGDWSRYPQATRQAGIVWAELTAAKHLHHDDCRKLINIQADLTVTNGIIANSDLPSDFLDVISIYYEAGNIVFKKRESSEEDLWNNQNTTYGYYWYYTDDGGIRLHYAANYTPTDTTKPSMRYKKTPSSKQGTFGTVSVSLDEYEYSIAKGASGFILNGEEGMEQKGKSLISEFYAELGITEKVFRNIQD